MRALVYTAVATAPVVTDVQDPGCPADGVLIEVRATGVCRSDFHAWKGDDPVRLPHVGGHELAGVIIEVGSQVDSWRPGDRVTVPFVCGCGRCVDCRAGSPQVCARQTQPGFTHWGSFAERVAIQAADFNLVRLPDDLDFVTAAALGCRFATAYRAVTGHASTRPGDRLAVYGAGGAGLSAVMIGSALGLEVVAVDPSAAARDRAADCGATLTIDPRADDPVAKINNDLGGVQLSLDCAGTAITAVQSVRSLRRGGHHVQVGLLFGESATPPVPMDRVIAWELSVHGSHGIAATDYPGLLELVISGRVDPARLIGEVTDLAGAGRALTAMAEPSTGAGITVAVP
ncbi:alcohol dehydrogenase catalytic domain-containing protein [Microlunatus soli]|uniref:Alcohol dehydrogenase n=1 Tax=Microlunatus soli TaxID=630515 RepID=A0A1H1MAE2_9ACTN|nr:alcohol dehydrogenase catalytic domain-containing protein [Microlunatus soli]SDR82959.1 alcohol dehydrogenase [Microlunatus soli]